MDALVLQGRGGPFPPSNRCLEGQGLLMFSIVSWVIGTFVVCITEN